MNIQEFTLVFKIGKENDSLDLELEESFDELIDKEIELLE